MIYNQWVDVDNFQWIDNPIYEWVVDITPTNLNQIWSDANYVYVALINGLDIININTELQVAKINYNEGFNSVCCDNTNVYLATNSGIKFIIKNDISPTMSGVSLHDFNLSIYGDEVLYIHCNNNNMICSTVSGINIIRQNNNEVIYNTTLYSDKCFSDGGNRYYYNVNNGTEQLLHRADFTFYNHFVADYTYTTNSGVLSNSSKINDFFVTTGTSSIDNFNTLFIATDKELFIIDEGSGNYKNLNILFSNDESVEFISVWADVTTKYNKHNLYVTTRKNYKETLFVVNLYDNSIIDYYTINHAGKLRESLNFDEPIIDININNNI